MPALLVLVVLVVLLMRAQVHILPTPGPLRLISVSTRQENEMNTHHIHIDDLLSIEGNLYRGFLTECARGARVFSEDSVEEARREGEQEYEGEIIRLLGLARSGDAVQIEGDPSGLFTLFTDMRRRARMLTNHCEGNADIVFYRDGARVALSTQQRRQSMYLMFTPMTWAMEDME